MNVNFVVSRRPCQQRLFSVFRSIDPGGGIVSHTWETAAWFVDNTVENSTFERRDPFLGLRDRGFRQHRLPFVPGDLLALYTDGLVEAQDEGGNRPSSRPRATAWVRLLTPNLS